MLSHSLSSSFFSSFFFVRLLLKKKKNTAFTAFSKYYRMIPTVLVDSVFKGLHNSFYKAAALLFKLALKVSTSYV